MSACDIEEPRSSKRRRIEACRAPATHPDRENEVKRDELLHAIGVPLIIVYLPMDCAGATDVGLAVTSNCAGCAAQTVEDLLFSKSVESREAFAAD